MQTHLCQKCKHVVSMSLANNVFVTKVSLTYTVFTYSLNLLTLEYLCNHWSYWYVVFSIMFYIEKFTTFFLYLLTFSWPLPLIWWVLVEGLVHMTQELACKQTLGHYVISISHLGTVYFALSLMGSGCLNTFGLKVIKYKIWRFSIFASWS